MLKPSLPLSSLPALGRPPRWSRTGIAAIVAALLALTAEAAVPPVTSMSVETLSVQPTPVTGARRSFDGSIEAVHQSTVSAQASGNVTALRVKAGDTVKAGQVLAHIDPRETQASLNQSQAAVAQAQAQARSARQQLDRTRDLRAQGFVSSAALDTAKAQWDTAQAALAQAVAAQAQASLARQFAVVTAPFAGVVSSTLVQPGDLAVPGRGIVVLYAPQPLRATVQWPMSAPTTTQTDHIRITLPDGQAVTPTATALLPAADPVAQTREWRLDLPATVRAVPGQAVRIDVLPNGNSTTAAAAAATTTTAASSPPQATSLALHVPASAVLQRGELTAVYRVQDARFVLRAVRVGPEVGGQRVVVSGLRPGDLIAVDALRAGLANAVPGAAAPSAMPASAASAASAASGR